MILAATSYWEVISYCLYRIFYYDCPPVSKAIYDPLRQKNIEFSKSDTYKWTIEFFEELKKKRKFALNVIKLSKKSFNDGYIGYTRNCVAFFLMLKMFLHHKKKFNIL